MNRFVFMFIFILLMMGCATYPRHTEEDKIPDTSPPLTADDISRSYSASLETVFEACKMAIKDIGADHLEPTFEMKENSAHIVASTKTRMYGIMLLGNDDHTDVMLFLEDKSTQDVIKKSVFDEFWTAVEAHL
jgi:hypothetical protein